MGSLWELEHMGVYTDRNTRITKHGIHGGTESEPPLSGKTHIQVQVDEITWKCFYLNYGHSLSTNKIILSERSRTKVSTTELAIEVKLVLVNLSQVSRQLPGYATTYQQQPTYATSRHPGQ